MKNPHAVALGRLGGAKGGPARAQALSPARRRAIARTAGLARTAVLSSSVRKEIARLAATTRWARHAVKTAQDAPVCVRRLLKTYDPAALKWANGNHRYAIVREILVRGDDEAKKWLHSILRPRGVRELVRQYGGAGCNEPERRQLRTELDLTEDDIPVRPYLGLE